MTEPSLTAAVAAAAAVTPFSLIFGSLLVLATRSGYFGRATLDMRPHNKFVYHDHHAVNCLLFDYFSYVKRDTRRVTASATPHLVAQKQWGVSLRPHDVITK